MRHSHVGALFRGTPSKLFRVSDVPPVVVSPPVHGVPWTLPRYTVPEGSMTSRSRLFTSAGFAFAVAGKSDHASMTRSWAAVLRRRRYSIVSPVWIPVGWSNTHSLRVSPGK